MTQKYKSDESAVETLGTSELGVAGTKNSQLKDLLAESAENSREDEEESFEREVPESRESSEVLESVDAAHLASLVEEIASAPPSDLRPNPDPNVAEALKATPRRPNSNAELMSIITDERGKSMFAVEGVREQEPATIPPVPLMSAEEAALMIPLNRAPEVEPPVADNVEKEYGGVEELEELIEKAEENPPVEPPNNPASEADEPALAPGYWQGFEGKYGRLNVFAYLGIAFIFVFFPLGFFFSLIGLHNSRAVPDDKLGKVISWIGMGLTSLLAVLALIQIVLLPFIWGLQFLPYMIR